MNAKIEECKNMDTITEEQEKDCKNAKHAKFNRSLKNSTIY